VNIIVKRSRFCWFLFCFVFNILYPSVCNSLPQTLRHSDYSSSFRTALKSVLHCPLKIEEFVLTFCVSRSLFQIFLKHVFFTDVAITAAATVSKCVCVCVRARARVCACACVLVELVLMTFSDRGFFQTEITVKTLTVENWLSVFVCLLACLLACFCLLLLLCACFP